MTKAKAEGLSDDEIRWSFRADIVSDERLASLPLVSVHDEPQLGPQEYECGCVTVTRITDRDARRGERPFEMRLARFCGTDACDRWGAPGDRSGGTASAALIDLLRRVEASVDAVPELTRRRPRGAFDEEAELVFGRSGWTVRVNVRNTGARGRGSRGFYAAQGDGDTPDLAVASFLERLPFFVQATK